MNAPIVRWIDGRAKFPFPFPLVRTVTVPGPIVTAIHKKPFPPAPIRAKHPSCIAEGVSLSAYVFLYRLQPHLTSHIFTTSNCYFPFQNETSLFQEFPPGMQIHRLIDRALKAADVQPATLVVERAYGMLEIHHQDKGQVLAGGQAILDYLGVTAEERQKPHVVSNTVIRSVEPYHAMILAKIRFCARIDPAPSLFIM